MKVKFEIDIGGDVMDIPTMESLAPQSYRNYLEELMWVDHHDVLRAAHGDYPLATSREQIDLMIGFLQATKARMPE